VFPSDLFVRHRLVRLEAEAQAHPKQLTSQTAVADPTFVALESDLDYRPQDLVVKRF
jgi:hypothetical protein